MHHRADTQCHLEHGMRVTSLGAKLHWPTTDPKVFPYCLLCFARAGYVIFFHPSCGQGEERKDKESWILQLGNIWGKQNVPQNSRSMKY